MKPTEPSASHNAAPWVDGRVTEEAMEHLWEYIRSSETETVDAKGTLAGNISKSKYIKDKDDWFYKNVLKKASEYMYFRDSEWSTYFDIAIAKTFPPPLFTLETLWVNYQKQHEFNPPHQHIGDFSFVVFMKIPTHWKEQHALPISVNSNAPLASDFSFVWSEKGQSNEVLKHNFPLSPEDEGRMLFFPAWLNHQVFPFYECEEERITVSGNIMLQERMKDRSLEEKKKQCEIMEKRVETLKEIIKIEEKEKQIGKKSE